MDSTILAAVITGVFGLAAVVLTVWLNKRPQREPDPGSRPVGRSPATTTGRTTALSLDEIVRRLDKYRQRATYGAVGGLLGRDPYTLFNGYPYTPTNSWVVAKANGLPTNYTRLQMHPDLELNAHVITTAEELRNWLSSNP